MRPDFAPTIYNLIDSLARLPRDQPLLPAQWNAAEVSGRLCCPKSTGGSSAATCCAGCLSRKGMSEARSEADSAIAALEHCGSTYLPQVNAFYVREFQMMHAAEDATRFLHQACQGLPHRLERPFRWEKPDM